MIKKFLCLAIATVAISGCAVKYTYEGETYRNKEEFHKAVDANVASTLATVVPLPSPLTPRKLIFAIPSPTAMVEESTRRYVKAKDSQPSGPAKEILENIPLSNFKTIKVFYDAVQKRNIYSSAQFVAMPEMTGSFPAAADTDTLVFIETAQNSGQWYYTSLKHGKQIFAYDRSSPTPAGKVQAFLEAVQVQAIRE